MSDIRSRNRSGHVVVPNWRCEDASLTVYDFRVAVWIASHTDTFRGTVSRNEISRRLTISQGAVSAALKNLAHAGIIEITTEGQRFVITFDFHAWETKPVDNLEVSPQPVDKPISRCSVTDHVLLGNRAADAHIEDYREQQVEDLAQPSLGVSDSFEAFWEVWPKKVSRGDAEKAWAVVRRTNDTAPIIEGAQRVADRWPDLLPAERKFIPYPGTWLRAKGWLDEFVIPADAPEPVKPPTPVADPDCVYCDGSGLKTLSYERNEVGPCHCLKLM